jgi:hypothetical protein
MNFMHSIIIIFLSLFSSTIATDVFPSTVRNCGNNVGQIFACGDTGLRNFNVVSARTRIIGPPARYFRNADCTGARITINSNTCTNFPFRPLCVRILC